MKKRRRRIWVLAVLGALGLVLADLGIGGSALARGGRRGGRGRRGGGGTRAAPSPSAGGAGRERSTDRKEEQERQRRDERISRVQLARIEYAKRERQALWDAEAAERARSMLDRLIGGATE